MNEEQLNTMEMLCLNKIFSEHPYLKNNFYLRGKSRTLYLAEFNHNGKIIFFNFLWRIPLDTVFSDLSPEIVEKLSYHLDLFA